MRKTLLVMVIISAAVICVAGIIVGIVGKVRSSYSSFSRGYWDLYPLTLDISASNDTLVFTAHGNGGRDLYSLNLQTRHIRQLTRSPQFEAEARFLDSSTVVVSAVEDPGRMTSPQYLYLLNVVNGTRRRLTEDPRMRDSTIVPISPDEFLFGRGEITERFNPVWGFISPPWGFRKVYSVSVGDYLMNTRTGKVEQVHNTCTWIYLDQVGAVFADRQRVIQLISQGITDDMFLTRLSMPLGSSELRAMRKKRLARNACCPVLSEDERFVYYVAGEPSGTEYSIARFDLRLFKNTPLAQRKQKITCMRRAGNWLYFLEGSGKDVTLWRMDTQGKRLEKLLSPSQFANPLGQ